MRGVDVSSYQGTIASTALAGQDIGFTFIKATEGSRYRDDCFSENWERARQTELLVGAYHFFSFDSGGEQAQNFMDNVKKTAGFCHRCDIELYGDKKHAPPNREALWPN